MAQEAIAFAAPRVEEMTEVVADVGGASITGVVEGVIVKMAPKMGAAEPIITWGTLLGVPLVGIGGALFTRGMIGDLFKGVAGGGCAILGYSLPELLVPGMFERKLTPEQIAAGRDVKLLGQGANEALHRAQTRARSSLEIG